VTGSPQLLVVAGPNGSGKTTWLSLNEESVAPLGLVQFLNPDMVARELLPSDVTQARIAAGREIVRRSVELLAQRQSFGFETTLAGHHGLRIMREAQVAGYEVTLVFLAISDVRINLERVTQRQSLGGHGIPESDIVRRYRRSFENLEAALDFAEHVWLVDNSVPNRPHQFAQASGTTVKITQPVPECGRQAVAHLVRRAGE
jgi:predicted ABC-type ATPase